MKTIQGNNKTAKIMYYKTWGYTVIDYIHKTLDNRPIERNFPTLFEAENYYNSIISKFNT